jgi:ribonuclease P/MRP protein subunit POP5
MTRVPVKNGKNCVFRVVRVSGTIRKAEEEAIRRARDMILKARREVGEQSDSTLDNIFGKGDSHVEADSTKDILAVDRSDSEGEEELSNDDG